MPLMERGDRVPSGWADGLNEAKADFRRAFENWIEQVPAEVQARNRDYLTYTVRTSRWQE